MIYGFDRSSGADRQEIAALATDVQVRVLNVSAAGCLLETNRALEIGHAATLRITFSGGDFEDTVQIVRCQEITGRRRGVSHRHRLSDDDAALDRIAAISDSSSIRAIDRLDADAEKH